MILLWKIDEKSVKVLSQKRHMFHGMFHDALFENIEFTDLLCLKSGKVERAGCKEARRSWLSE